jgi:cytoskeleton protein RodZ
MGSFGERLRREREMRGITLNEIMESTKISRRHLESLENEDFDSLPGGIFNKGFVRAYARYLGIDEEQAVADYSAATETPPESEDEFPLEIHDQPNPRLNPSRSSQPLILALVALLAVLAVFWAKTRDRTPDNSETTPAPEAAPSPIAPASPSPLPLQEAQEAPSPPPAVVAPAVNISPASATNTASQTHALATKTPSPERMFSIMVTAKEDAWVSLTADGKMRVTKMLRAGERQSVRAWSRVVLTTGNAGGIDINFNGKALGAIGHESQKRTLTFTPAGLVQ